MPEVHPTAIMGPDVELAFDVTVGPGCVIDGSVRVGSGTRLLHRVTLQGPLTIGANNQFYPNSVIGMAPQDLKYDPTQPGAGLEIGDNNIFREGVTLHRATQDQPTRIGDRNYFMANSHVAHDCVLGNDITLVNGTVVGGHAEIADHVILGGGSAIHQFCRVGRMAMISGLQGIGQDLPPFCVCYRSRSMGSLNLVGLRRAGHRDSIPTLKKIFTILFCDGLPRAIACDSAQAVAEEDPLAKEMIQFVREATRGVTKYKKRNEKND